MKRRWVQGPNSAAGPEPRAKAPANRAGSGNIAALLTAAESEETAARPTSNTQKNEGKNRASSESPPAAGKKGKTPASSNSPTTAKKGAVKDAANRELKYKKKGAFEGIDDDQQTKLSYPNPRNFAERLMGALELGLESDMVWWVGEGKAVALNPKKLKKTSSWEATFQAKNYSALLRNFNRWGFRRVPYYIDSVPDGAVTYQNSLFQKSKPHLVKHMRMDSDVQDVFERHQESKTDDEDDAMLQQSAVRLRNPQGTGGIPQTGNILVNDFTRQSRALAQSTPSAPMNPVSQINQPQERQQVMDLLSGQNALSASGPLSPHQQQQLMNLLSGQMPSNANNVTNNSGPQPLAAGSMNSSPQAFAAGGPNNFGLQQEPVGSMDQQAIFAKILQVGQQILNQPAPMTSVSAQIRAILQLLQLFGTFQLGQHQNSNNASTAQHQFQSDLAQQQQRYFHPPPVGGGVTGATPGALEHLIAQANASNNSGQPQRQPESNSASQGQGLLDSFLQQRNQGGWRQPQAPGPPPQQQQQGPPDVQELLRRMLQQQQQQQQGNLNNGR